MRRAVGTAARREATGVRRGPDASALDLDSQSPVQGGISRRVSDVKNVIYQSRPDVGQRQRSSRFAKQLNRREVLAAARQKHLAGHSHEVRPRRFHGVEL